MSESQTQKSAAAQREEKVLEFWNSQNIFEKTLQKEAPGGDFVFYEGPPTANAKPALHHLAARAFKDTLPRYKTMQGFHVRRKAGWDTHGLPVELQIEKKLGLQSKKDIEGYGVAKFNTECKESVHEYIGLWQTFTERMGYWVDFDDAYYTYNPQYMESLWSIVKKISDRGLLYKDYRIVPWCARCGTGLSTHELAQEYQDVKDLSVTAKFKIVGEENTYILAWTTTPWTLPGNVALAVGEDIEYVVIEKFSSLESFEKKQGEPIVIQKAPKNEFLILAKERLTIVEGEYEVIKEMKGSDLAGLSYEPLYKIEGIENAYKVQTADFVTTTDGTGVVHIAPMYGADDFALATKLGLPKVHTVDDTGNFIAGVTPEFLVGRFVKTEEVAVDIIKDLAHRGHLFKKEKYEHSYPHCWRCKTPLLYYARDSWYVGMSQLRNELMAANDTVNWNPAHIKEGRFGEWIKEAKDWAFSRERYWGTPLPVWTSADGDMLVVDSIDTLKAHTKKSGNEYFVMRHGETEHNVAGVWNCSIDGEDALTEKGIAQVVASAKAMPEQFDYIFVSPFPRTLETASLVAVELGLDISKIVSDARLVEWNVGAEFDGKPMDSYFSVRNMHHDRYNYKVFDGESYADVVKRSGEFLYELESKYQGKKILIVSHGAVVRALEFHSKGISFDSLFKESRDYKNFANAEIRKVDFVPLPHNEKYEIDLHRPYIDQALLIKDGKEYTRVKEVMDVWFDSGAMPFAQEHYPFNQDILYPADFISEAIDQTRGWFYTLLTVGVLMDRSTPYKNVICLGHLLDKDGKKMSKSVGNIVEPFEQMEKFGADAVRYWMYSVNQPGESKNYDEKSVAEIQNKVFSLTYNVLSFYEMYRDPSLEIGLSLEKLQSENVLDVWILARLNQLVSEMTTDLDNFELFHPTRSIKDFIDDMSTWYVRRSRERLRDGDVDAKKTLYVVLKTLAQLLAPFAPFSAEDLWQKLKTEKDEVSVHLSVWPKAGSVDSAVIEEMEKVRSVCTEGNALRKKVGIAVKQPLASFSMPHTGLEKYYALIQDELNVKSIVVGDFALDTEITPELKKEGEYRELVRAVQDMRKEKGLSPSDTIVLTIPQTYHDTIADMELFKKTVQADTVSIGEEISLEIK